MCITWPHICFTIHLLWCIAYTVIGTIQIICGVFFFISLPVLKLGSNIWVGAWNVLFGIGGAVTAMMGKWTLSKQRTFLYLAVSVLIANVINLVLLEVGEWHILLPESAKKLIEQGSLKMLVLYARTITSLSTIVAAVVAFIDSQLTFCSMQYHEKYHKKQPEKQDVLSDTEYVLPRVKSDSDENDNAGYYNKQYPQSWVYETQTAETSTINSVPNRYSGTSSDNLIDSKPTSSEAEFKDISTQNLNIEQPIVVVENTSDYTDRQLHYMASFSRTPSPVPGSDSSSDDLRSNDPPIQESLEKLTEPSVYRSRLNSALSASGVPRDRPSPTVSPRPPSISGMDQLQQELLRAELQETVSQKSFKISADQIFIPLKDETVIRVKDEVFIMSPKISPKVEEYTTQMSAAPAPALPPKNAYEVPSLPPAREAEKPTVVPKTEPERPSLPEIVYAVHKDSSLKSPRDLWPRDPSPKEETPSIAPVETRKPSLQNIVEQYLTTTQEKDPAPVAESAPSPTGSYTITSPVLERQEQVDRQDTVVAKDYTLPSPVLERQPQFDRQDTVVERKPYLPSPVQERQSQIERQDAILSPKEDQCFVPPPLEPEAVESPMDEDPREDVSNNSNNVSTDKETIIDFTGSDENVQAQDTECVVGMCDTLDLIEGIKQPEEATSSGFGNEIDNIFKIAEDPRLEERDREDAELFDMEKGSSSSDLLPEMDASMFANIPPPEDTDEADEVNGVDPDEWEESDDDSIDSSCVRRVPPPSTPND